MTDLNAEMQQYLDTRPDKAATLRQTAAEQAAAKKAAAAHTIELLFSHAEQVESFTASPAEPDDDPNAILRDIFN